MDEQTTMTFVASSSSPLSSGSSVCIDIDILDDEDYEKDHDFMVSFGSILPPPPVMATGTVFINIMDNNGKQMYSVAVEFVYHRVGRLYM